MASNYPTSLDSFTNPTANDSLNSPSHALQHANANDAIEAIEAKLGIGESTAGSATEGYVLTAGTGGTTTWSAPSIAGLTQIIPTSITKGASGSASVSAGGSVTFTGTESISLNGCFSATYQNYKIIIILTSIAGGGARLDSRLRSGTSDNTSANYWWNRVYSTSSTVVSQGNTSLETIFAYTGEYNQGISISDIDIFNPFETQYTAISTKSNFRYNQAGAYQHSVTQTGQLSVTTSYDGFTFLPNSGTINGNLRIYGYKNG